MSFRTQIVCAVAGAMVAVLAAGCSLLRSSPVSSSTAADRGHVRVLNFWGSWCSICQQETPALAAAARQFTQSGVRFVGVDVADNAASGIREAP